MTRTLDSDLVAMHLDSAQNRFVTVDFLTKSGEPRTYNGQLRATSRLVGSARGHAQGAGMRDRGQVWLALPSGKSKSFYIDRVTGLAVDGNRLGTQA